MSPGRSQYSNQLGRGQAQITTRETWSPPTPISTQAPLFSDPGQHTSHPPTRENWESSPNINDSIDNNFEERASNAGTAEPDGLKLNKEFRNILDQSRATIFTREKLKDYKAWRKD